MAGQAEGLGSASAHSRVDPQVHVDPCTPHVLSREVDLQVQGDVLALERGPVSVARAQGWVRPDPRWCPLQEKQDGRNAQDRNNAVAGSSIPRPKKAR